MLWIDFFAAIEQKIAEVVCTIGEFCWEFADWEWGGQVFNKGNKNQEVNKRNNEKV